MLSVSPARHSNLSMVAKRKRFVSDGFDVETRAKKTEFIVEGMVLITDHGVKIQQRREERQEGYNKEKKLDRIEHYIFKKKKCYRSKNT